MWRRRNLGSKTSYRYLSESATLLDWMDGMGWDGKGFLCVSLSFPLSRNAVIDCNRSPGGITLILLRKPKATMEGQMRSRRRPQKPHPVVLSCLLVLVLWCSPLREIVVLFDMLLLIWLQMYINKSHPRRTSFTLLDSGFTTDPVISACRHPVHHHQPSALSSSNLLFSRPPHRHMI